MPWPSWEPGNGATWEWRLSVSWGSLATVCGLSVSYNSKGVARERAALGTYSAIRARATDIAIPSTVLCTFTILAKACPTMLYTSVTVHVLAIVEHVMHLLFCVNFLAYNPGSIPQEFGFSDLGEMQFEEDLCFDVSSSKVGGQINILNCHGLGGNQKWEYDDKVGPLSGHVTFLLHQVILSHSHVEIM